jgi:hypothetical protein
MSSYSHVHTLFTRDSREGGESCTCGTPRTSAAAAPASPAAPEPGLPPALAPAPSFILFLFPCQQEHILFLFPCQQEQSKRADARASSWPACTPHAEEAACCNRAHGVSLAQRHATSLAREEQPATALPGRAARSWRQLCWSRQLVAAARRGAIVRDSRSRERPRRPQHRRRRPAPLHQQRARSTLAFAFAFAAFVFAAAAFAAAAFAAAASQQQPTQPPQPSKQQPSQWKPSRSLQQQRSRSSCPNG